MIKKALDLAKSLAGVITLSKINWKMIFSWLRQNNIKPVRIKFLVQACGYNLTKDQPVPRTIEPGEYEMVKTPLIESFGHRNPAVWYLFKHTESGLTETALERLIKENKVVIDAAVLDPLGEK